MIYDLTIKDYIIFRETIKKIVVPLWIFLIVSTIVLAREPSIFLIAFKHYHSRMDEALGILGTERGTVYAPPRGGA